MKLSKRLGGIASFVPKNSIVGDVGTDHGYIPVYLIDEGVAKKVIATDISENSLKKIVNYVKLEGYEENIDTRLGDGLDVIKPFEIDTLIIAGMGGVLITEILDAHKEVRDSITHFILQGNVATKELRQYLYDNNFKIVDEKLVKEDGRFYEIIYAKKGKFLVEHPIHLEIGKKLITNKDPLLGEFINYKKDKAKNIARELENEKSENAKKRKQELLDYIEELEEVEETIEGN